MRVRKRKKRNGVPLVVIERRIKQRDLTLLKPSGKKSPTVTFPLPSFRKTPRRRMLLPQGKYRRSEPSWENILKLRQFKKNNWMQSAKRNYWGGAPGSSCPVFLIIKKDHALFPSVKTIDQKWPTEKRKLHHLFYINHTSFHTEFYKFTVTTKTWHFKKSNESRKTFPKQKKKAEKKNTSWPRRRCLSSIRGTSRKKNWHQGFKIFTQYKKGWTGRM